MSDQSATHPGLAHAAAASPGRARWARLLPIAFVTYSLAYLDRSNYSIGVAGGMKGDLHLDAGVSALLGALFFLGYFLFQVPAGIYAERRSARTLIFWSLLAWGVLASLQGVVTSVPWLMVVRFLLGVVEAAVLPAMVIFLSHWFTKAERGRANTYLILGNPVTVLWLTAVSGYLVEATSWRWMFIIEGVPAIIWAFVFRALVSDRPHEARWLSKDERGYVEDALEAEQRSMTPAASLWSALRSRNVVILSVQYFLWSLGVYGFVFWLPSIVKAASGAGIGMTGLISAIPYVFAVLFMVVNSRFSDLSGHRNRYVWPWLALSAVAFYGSYLLGTKNFWAAFVLLVIAGAAMYAPYGPFFAAIPELMPRDVAGPAIALVNSLGALGGFVGSYFVGWLDGATGSSSASFLLMAASLAGSAVLIPFVRPRTAAPSGSTLRTAES